MISMHLPIEAYQLAAEYKLGEPIRVYSTNKRQQIKSSGWIGVGISLIFMLSMLMQNSFRLRASDLILYSICLGIVVIAALFIFISILRAPNMTVYICASGFIVLDQSSSEAVRWEQIERVKSGETNSCCLLGRYRQTRYHLEQICERAKGTFRGNRTEGTACQTS
jgi:hypothetical protein